MKTIIKIDRESIRRNPDAGRTEWMVPALTWVEVFTPNGEYRSVGKVEIEAMPDGSATVRGEFIQTRAFNSRLIFGEQKLEFSTSDNRIVGHQEYEEFRNMSPAPKWLYSYIPTQVKCDKCGAEFPDIELESDSCDDAEGNYTPINNICPKCGKYDCCEIEYERIEDVVQGG